MSESLALRIERVELRASLPPTPLYVLLRIIASNTFRISKTVVSISGSTSATCSLFKNVLKTFSISLDAKKFLSSSDMSGI